MVLELHIWGPAFSLPSIDPQCLAAIAYFSLVVPKEAWVLIPTSDPSVSPTSELPALKNGPLWVSRFRNIVDYLRQYSQGSWDLDDGLSERERADNIAFSSFVEAHAHPLLDLSLYVTSQNYYANTSPSYARILQWPNQWILPPKLHSAAKSRTEPLGVSSLDLQAIDEQRKRDHSAAVAAGHIPQNFIQRPRDTVSGLLGKTAQQNQFRLDALTEEVFEPLEEILGEKRYLLSNSSSKSGSGACTLDCLANGYLSLMLVPDLAYPWLRDAMNAKAPQLTAYTERMRQRCFGSSPAPAPTDPTTTTTTTTATTQQDSLPWRARPRVNLYQISSTLLSSLADAVPVVRDLRNHNRLRSAAEAADSGLSGVEQRALSQYATGQKKDVVLSAVMVVGGVAALVGYMVRVGLVSIDIDTGDGGGGDSEDGEELAGEGAVDMEGLDMKATDFLGV